MPDTPFRVRFFGTRGSIPSPGPRTQTFGGNTSCVELRVEGQILICDAGTGIRDCGDNLLKESGGKPLEAKLFVTHTHWDHIQGFPFFIPGYILGNRFIVHGPHNMGRSFEKLFRDLMDPNYFPVQVENMTAKIDFVEVEGRPLEYGALQVASTFTNHPGMDIAYRFAINGRSVAYITDHENYEAMHERNDYSLRQDKLMDEFCRGADLLICDAQYTDEEYLKKKTWGHSRYKDTVRLAVRSGVKALALHHHDPYHPDEQLAEMEKDAKAFARAEGGTFDCFMSREGMVLDV